MPPSAAVFVLCRPSKKPTGSGKRLLFQEYPLQPVTLVLCLRVRPAVRESAMRYAMDVLVDSPRDRQRERGREKREGGREKRETERRGTKGERRGKEGDSDKQREAKNEAVDVPIHVQDHVVERQRVLPPQELLSVYE